MRAAALLALALPLLLGVAPSAKPSATLPKPSATLPDRLASPSETWSQACKALQSNDLAAFCACFYNRNELSSLFLKAYSDTMLTTFRLARAAASLGAEGQALAAKLDRVTFELMKSSEDRTTTTIGEIARWSRLETNPDGRKSEHVIYFRHVDGQWLIDTEKSYALDDPDGRQAAEAYLAAAATELPAMKGVIRDIESGKIKTYQEMQKRFAAPPLPKSPPK